MRRRDLKWAAAAAAAVSVALFVVGAGAVAPASLKAEGRLEVPSSSSAAAARIEVIGVRDVPALSGEDGPFAEALAAYLDQAGEPASSATVVADPRDPSAGSFYVCAGGLWYSCEATGSASGWAFSSLGARSPVASGRAADPSPARVGEGEWPAAGEPSGDQVDGAASEPREWVPLSDARSLAAALGSDAASRLAEAMAGYAAAKGIGFDADASRVDASSVRAEPGGVGFVADTGSVLVDVVYAGGEYGFKVI